MIDIFSGPNASISTNFLFSIVACPLVGFGELHSSQISYSKVNQPPVQRNF
jgi:hypothetical protein